MKIVREIAFAGVMFSLLALVAAPAYAAGPNDIHSFIACLNKINSTNVADAVACVPSNCYTTVTVSGESAQPGCTLRDGTRLPRVIFSCPGSSAGLQFRPSFSLCTNSGDAGGPVINHIEVGEDVKKRTGTDDPELRQFPWDQKMADIDSTLNFKNLTEFGTVATAVVDTPTNSKGCAECHDQLGTVGTGASTANAFLPIPPDLADGTIFSNDPTVVHPAVQTGLTVICAKIQASTLLKRTLPKYNLAVGLCNALQPFAP